MYSTILLVTVIVILFLMMCLSTYNDYARGDGMDKMMPDLVFGLLLGCHFTVI